VLISSLLPTVKVDDKCLVRSACQHTDLFKLSKLPANIGLVDTRINEQGVLYLFASHSSKGGERIYSFVKQRRIGSVHRPFLYIQLGSGLTFFDLRLDCFRVPTN